MQTVCHITSAHKHNDVRIFLKECSSLAKNNYNVSLVVANTSSQKINNVNIIGVNSPNISRLTRWTKTVWNVYKTAKDLNADLYHLHDPELLLVALLLKNKNNKVVFDAHEDLPKQILDKPYINKRLRKLVAFSIGLFERVICKKLDGVITATPSIEKKFLAINKNTLCVNNFPLDSELQSVTNWATKKNEVCFIGAISEIRGITHLVNAAPLVSAVKFNLVGNINPTSYKESLINNKNWSSITWHGEIDRTSARKILESCKAGLVTFLPAANHIEAQPNKMFEYMSAGIPVISSNFPMWKSIIEANKCGICVNPSNEQEIATAILYLMNNDKEAQAMGARGRAAVVNLYNWNKEEQKLVNFYFNLLNTSAN